MNDNITVEATFEKRVPKILVSTDHLDFGKVEEGKKSTQTITFSNTGTADLLITFSVEGQFFSIRGKSSVTIKPGKSYNLNATFQPKASSEELNSTEPVLPSNEGIEEEIGSAQPTQCTGTIHYKTDDPLAEGFDLSLEGFSVPLIPVVLYSIEIDYTLLKIVDTDTGTLEEKDTATGVVELYYQGKDHWLGSANIECEYDMNSPAGGGTGKGPVNFVIQADVDHKKHLLTINQFDEKGQFEVTECCVNGQPFTFSYTWEVDHVPEIEAGFFTFPLKEGAAVVHCGSSVVDTCHPLCKKANVTVPYPLDHTCIIYTLQVESPP